MYARIQEWSERWVRTNFVETLTRENRPTRLASVHWPRAQLLERDSFDNCYFLGPKLLYPEETYRAGMGSSNLEWFGPNELCFQRQPGLLYSPWQVILQHLPPPHGKATVRRQQPQTRIRGHPNISALAVDKNRHCCKPHACEKSNRIANCTRLDRQCCPDQLSILSACRAHGSRHFTS